jgi:hypothetical protein
MGAGEIGWKRRECYWVIFGYKSVKERERYLVIVVDKGVRVV